LKQSFRISSDLRIDCEYPDFFRSKLIVRKFVPIEPMNEYRAFVCKGKINALSQYESVYFPDLPQKKQQIEDEILAFFEKIKSHITQQAYVIDFCFVNQKLLIVELNPFHANTSGCLFRWKNDREQILNGPFSFRIVDQAPPNVLEQMPTQWSDFVEEFYEIQSLTYKLCWTVGLMVVVADVALTIFETKLKRKP